MNFGSRNSQARTKSVNSTKIVFSWKLAGPTKKIRKYRALNMIFLLIQFKLQLR